MNLQFASLVCFHGRREVQMVNLQHEVFDEWLLPSEFWSVKLEEFVFLKFYFITNINVGYPNPADKFFGNSIWSFTMSEYWGKIFFFLGKKEENWGYFFFFFSKKRSIGVIWIWAFSNVSSNFPIDVSKCKLAWSFALIKYLTSGLKFFLHTPSLAHSYL